MSGTDAVFLIESLGWLVIVFLLVIIFVLYLRLHQQLATLRQNMTQLQNELQQHKNSVQSSTSPSTSSHAAPEPVPNSLADSAPRSGSVFSAETTILPVPTSPPSELSSAELGSISTPKTVPLLDPNPSIANSAVENMPIAQHTNDALAAQTKNKTATAPIEPDERSLSVVTSLFNSVKNWFLGGNLVVRVGVLVLLMGVVLLLRLLSST